MGCSLCLDEAVSFLSFTSQLKCSASQGNSRGKSGGSISYV